MIKTLRIKHIIVIISTTYIYAHTYQYDNKVITLFKYAENMIAMICTNNSYKAVLAHLKVGGFTPMKSFDMLTHLADRRARPCDNDDPDDLPSGY